MNNLAYLYAERLNQLDKAYDLARKARALKPEDAATADTLGWILYKRADFDGALALLKESATKLPNIPEIQFHLGMAYYMMGRIEAARTALRQAAEAQSDFPGKRDLERRLALLEDGSGKLTNPHETNWRRSCCSSLRTSLLACASAKPTKGKGNLRRRQQPTKRPSMSIPG